MLLLCLRALGLWKGTYSWNRHNDFGGNSGEPRVDGHKGEGGINDPILKELKVRTVLV